MNEILRMSLLLANGCKVTLEIFIVTLVLSIPLGLLLALGRISSIKPLNKAVEIYNWVMRGTPLMLQLLFVYFALPSFGITLPDVAAALLAFVLNYAAYFAEIFRAGIQSIPKGQYEAAKTLGFTYPQTMQKIIVPQMIKRVLPPIGNETITLVKDTSLVYVLAMNDLLRAARTIVQREFDMTPFFIAAVFYLIMTFVVTRVFAALEEHYAKYEE
jgi:polar amino acid transport system permease protein